MEQRVVALRLCTALLDIVDRKQWPACLRDMAGGLLQSLLERWSSVEVLGGLRWAGLACWNPHPQTLTPGAMGSSCGCN